MFILFVPNFDISNASRILIKTIELFIFHHLLYLNKIFYAFDWFIFISNSAYGHSKFINVINTNANSAYKFYNTLL